MKSTQLKLDIEPIRGSCFHLDEPIFDGTFWGKPQSMDDMSLVDKDKIKMAYPDGWKFVKLRGFDKEAAIIEDDHGNVIRVENKNAFRIPSKDAKRERRMG